MSFFGSIGKALGGVVHSVTSIADKVTNILKAPLDFVTKPIQGLMDGVLDKLPFGIGNFIKPFADQFLNMGVSWLAAGPLGGFMSTLSSVSGVASKIDDVLHVADNALNGGISSLPDPAQQNVQTGAAWAQAQGLFA